MESENSLSVPGGIFQLRAIETDQDPEAFGSLRPTIYLYDKQAVTLGRSRLTQIRDMQLSRKQVRIMASSDGDYVEATQISAVQPSCINGQPLLYPWSKMVMPGDILALCENKYEYVLERLDNKDSLRLDDIASPVTKKKRTASSAFATPSTPDENEKVKNNSKMARTTIRHAPMSPQELVDQLITFSSGKKKRSLVKLDLLDSDLVSRKLDVEAN